jgi:hypothetical protein
MARLGERLPGLSAKRSLPEWREDNFGSQATDHPADADGREVVLLADTFKRWFEP